MLGRDRPLRECGCGGREFWLQLLAGDGVPRREFARGADPQSGLPGADPEQPGQERGRVRTATLQPEPAVVGLAHQCVIDDREPADPRLEPGHQVEELLVAVGGQVLGGEPVQDVVEAGEQAISLTHSISLEHVFDLSIAPRISRHLPTNSAY
jgi:hypothetical protein